MCFTSTLALISTSISGGAVRRSCGRTCGRWCPWAHAESSSVWTDGNHLYAAGYLTRWHYVASVQDPAAVLWWRPISSPLPGDFNDNGAVDATALLKWQGDFGVNGESDADGDGDSDGADFLIWQEQYGIDPAAVSTSPAIPEPATVVLLALAAGICVKRRRTIAFVS